MKELSLATLLAFLCLFAHAAQAESEIHADPSSASRAIGDANQEFETSLKEILRRGGEARRELGYKDDDPAPILDFFRKNPEWPSHHAAEIIAVANSNRDLKRAKAAMASMLTALADEKEFQEILRETLKKKVSYILRAKVFEATLRYMRTGVAGPGLIAEGVVDTVLPLKNAMLGLPLDTPEDGSEEE